MSKQTIRLTEIDLQLMAKLSQTPALSTREIYKIFYSARAEKHAYRRLGQLVRAGYLLRYPYLGPRFGNKTPENRKTTSLYALSSRGALVANASKAPRAFKRQHWLHYFQSVLCADLISKGVISHRDWFYSGHIKAKSTIFQVWEPFHALVSLANVKFYIYFLLAPLQHKHAGALRQFGKRLYSRFRYETDRSVKRYYLIISPGEDYRDNLKKLALEPIMRMHIVTYNRAASVMVGLCKGSDYFLEELVNRARLTGLFYGKEDTDLFRRHSKKDGKKVHAEEFASGAISTAYKIARYRADIPVVMLIWPEMREIFAERPKFQVYEIE